MIVIIIMANIWKAHFRFDFRQAPFRAVTALSNIRLDILQMIDEGGFFLLLYLPIFPTFLLFSFIIEDYLFYFDCSSFH
jgi:hypothetical protein